MPGPTERIGELFASRPWYQLPRLLAMVKLVEIRDDLREKNLHDTEEPPFEKQDVPAVLDPALREGRSVDGTFNDLHVPKMGAAGCRFGQYRYIVGRCVAWHDRRRQHHCLRR